MLDNKKEEVKEEKVKEEKITCEVRNSAFRIDNKRYPVGSIAQFDKTIVAERPDILFPIAKADKIESKMKDRVLSLQERNKQLEDENIKLIFNLTEEEKNEKKLTKIIEEKIEQIHILKNQLKEIPKKE